jgi:hypothetical protein
VTLADKLSATAETFSSDRFNKPALTGAQARVGIESH